jgi:hypothetical protein
MFRSDIQQHPMALIRVAGSPAQQTLDEGAWCGLGDAKRDCCFGDRICWEPRDCGPKSMWYEVIIFHCWPVPIVCKAQFVQHFVWHVVQTCQPFAPKHPGHLWSFNLQKIMMNLVCLPGIPTSVVVNTSFQARSAKGNFILGRNTAWRGRWR